MATHWFKSIVGCSHRYESELQLFRVRIKVCDMCGKVTVVGKEKDTAAS